MGLFEFITGVDAETLKKKEEENKKAEKEAKEKAAKVAKLRTVKISKPKQDDSASDEPTPAEMETEETTEGLKVPEKAFPDGELPKRTEEGKAKNPPKKSRTAKEFLDSFTTGKDESAEEAIVSAYNKAKDAATLAEKTLLSAREIGNEELITVAEAALEEKKQLLKEAEDKIHLYKENLSYRDLVSILTHDNIERAITNGINIDGVDSLCEALKANKSFIETFAKLVKANGQNK